MSLRRPFVPAVLLLALGACTADRVLSPESLDQPSVAASHSGGTLDDLADPHFLSATPDAPTVANPVISFWAKKGVDQTVRMVYHAEAGRRDSLALFSIRIRQRSLAARPDGTPIALGDSVLVTLTLVDAQHMVVDCQPSGLRFDPRSPATIRLSYAHADVDGVPGSTLLGVTLSHALAIWRRESPASPWLPMVSRELQEADEVEADIGGFTGYALAW